LNFHYHPETGEIVSWDNSNGPLPAKSHFSGHVVAAIKFIGQHSDIDPKRHKIANGQVVEKTAAEKTAALLPTLHEIKCAILRDLEATDSLAVLDRPMADDVRAAWRTYRQALRDLSKLPGPSNMVRAWPIRPDGVDAITDMRKRIPDARD
jgi:hypothetical protein